MNIEKMNQSELIDLARDIENGESGRSFEESAEFYKNSGDTEKAAIFEKMVERWWDIEK